MNRIINDKISLLIKFPLIVYLLLLSYLYSATTGKIAGRAIDAESGDPLIGINVILVGTALGTASGIDGYFTLINIPPGQYSLRFMMIGYQNLVMENVEIRSDHTTTVNTELNQTVLQSKNEVTVIASRPVIDMDRTSTESSISSDQIEQMPVETIDDILNLQAGVVDGHFRGGRSQEVVYQIDGIQINDAYSGGAAMMVENDVIQELKVISGTFNAEYGQAQSGVVDIITKNGTSHFTGSAGISTGDYISSNSDIFWNINDFSLKDYNMYNLFISGPILDKMNFLYSVRYTGDEGYLYGKNAFLPVDSIKLGDNKYHPMGYNNRLSSFGKISYAFSAQDRVSISLTYQNREQNRDFDIYDHLFRYNPMGQQTSYEETIIGLVNWNHILSPKTFFNIRASMNQKDHQQYVYEDSLDSRYSIDNRLNLVGNFSFYTGGTDMTYLVRSADQVLIKCDLTSQITKKQQLQVGAEYTKHNLTLNDLVLKKNSSTNFDITVPPTNTADNQKYNHNPVQAATYIQTKWESKTIIMNLGIRFDYFNAFGDVITDFERPRTSVRIESDPSYQLSPRLGIAYPITSKGVMHISYGHFFQIPEFQYLYSNPSFTVNPEEGIASVLNYPFGNPNLKAQKTIGYEIGLQQELTTSLALDVTAYYKDIRNLLGSELNTIATLEEHSGIRYGRYINRDYGQVKGFTLAFDQKPVRGVSASVDYTFMTARGNASDPKSILLDAQSDPPVESEKQLVPLDWDRTHSLNGSVTFNKIKSYAFTIICKAGSGMPYTPVVRENQFTIENSDRKPYQVTCDVYLMKQVDLKLINLKLTLKVYNFFDRLNEVNVYNDSGRAGYTEELNNPGLAQGLNTKEEFFIRPDWYQSPRKIIFGISTHF